MFWASAMNCCGHLQSQAFAIVIFAVVASGCRTPATRESTPTHSKSIPVEKSFVKAAKLSDSELHQVITLARQCGVVNVAKVETFYFLPTGSKGISAKSKERIDGRSHFYDEIVIERVGWGSSEPSTNAVRLGKFWADPTAKYTRQLREYELKNRTFLIHIGDGVDVLFADKAIPLIFARKFSFSDEEREVMLRLLEKQLFQFKPVGIYRDDDGDYELNFESSSGMWEILRFKMENDKIYIIGMGSRVA